MRLRKEETRSAEHGENIKRKGPSATSLSVELVDVES